MPNFKIRVSNHAEFPYTFNVIADDESAAIPTAKTYFSQPDVDGITFEVVRDIPAGYLRIWATDWLYAPLRCSGLVLRAPDGQEIYCQPGDDANAMRDNIDALGEIEDVELQRGIAASLFGEYFA